MPVPESYQVEMGLCAFCSRAIASDSYRDSESLLEARFNLLCQRCIDRTYFGVDQEEGRVLPIFDGAVVAVRSPDSIVELALLPFRLVVPGSEKARIAWEARFITRAGSWLNPLDLAYELDPMAGLLLGHQVRLTEHKTSDASVVSELLGRLHLLIALDRRSVEGIGEICPTSDRTSKVALAEDVPWIEVFGQRLLPLDRWISEPAPLSTLRTIAVMGLLLMEQGRDRCRPLDHLLRHRPEFFPEKSDEQA